ncbi:MAG: hypothetical protein KatS3mg093_391 [Candidatus Parcubacteria bacterium]|nr:MAG: hypothetical protein KatS3mg093_391 [Candidatus Parcubacteria bacterium]
MKVIFANQIYDLCQKLGANYELVKQALENESRIGKSHLNIFHGGYRGFGGKCFTQRFKRFNGFILKN